MRNRKKCRRVAALSFIAVGTFLLSGVHLSSQDVDPFLVERAYSDSQGVVHIVYRDGDKKVPKEKDQVSARSIKVSGDKKTVGWALEVENCCTSYPIPVAIVIYKDNKMLRRIDAGLMIYEWNFVASGKQVAYCSGTVHGDFPTNCFLHDSRTGRQLATYTGGRRVPKWMKALDNE